MRNALVDLLLLSASLLGTACIASAGSLEADFRDPPVTVRPFVWWHWMGSNFSKEGITRDLEAMKAAGIGGATIFNLSSAVQESHAPTENNPWPDQTYRSPKYWEAIRHAAAEADRLGLEVGLHNTVGYSTTGGPWIDEPRSMQRLIWSSAEVTGGKTITAKLPVPEIPLYGGWGKTGRRFSYFQDIAVLAVPTDRSGLDTQDVLDLSSKLSPAGELRWDAPKGKWIIYRLGHSTTGATPHPVPDDVLGKALEADKMSIEQTRFHWNTVINPLKEHLGPLLGKGLRHFLIDSYEAGYQNWTPAFRDEFKKRKGYDPLPWLVTMGAPVNNGKGKTLRTLGSAEQTARFEWDYRDMIATLYYENGWKPAVDMMHAVGCKLQFEPYGGPFDTVSGAALADLPMGEFWTSGKGGVNQSVVTAARAAGRTVVGAEAFTGSPAISKWTETPAFLKLSADGTYASGVNRLVLHHWVHQPFDDRFKPGMGMGWWGTHFGRNQTWFEPGKEFFRYLGRTQALLHRGETPSDFVSVASSVGGSDVIPWHAFRSDVSVREGRIVLASGRTYAFINITGEALLPGDVKKIGDLLAAGATVVCHKPRHSPSLSNYPACDDQVQTLAAPLWGDGKEPVRTVGKGKLYATGDVNAALQDLGITPAVQILTPAAKEVRFAHRRDGQTDIFFLANLDNSPQVFTVSFRIAGMQPELWNAETASIQLAPIWRAKEGRTEVDLSLGAEKSIFVVFRQKLPGSVDQLTTIVGQGCTLACDAAGRPVVSAASTVTGTAIFASGKRVPFTLKPSDAIPIPGPWTVDFAPAVGAAPARITLDKLASLSEQADPAVRYFSGTATYRTTIKLDTETLKSGQRLHLDLGNVCNLVRITVNGQDLGVIWHPPFVRDITDALKPGDNTLELAVTNTWHNRLVGDEQEPADFEWGTDRGAKMGRAIKAYPDWFLKNQPRPSTGRQGFIIWSYHRKETPLQPAGLLGPVQLAPQAQMIFQP